MYSPPSLDEAGVATVDNQARYVLGDSGHRQEFRDSPVLVSEYGIDHIIHSSVTSEM